MTADAHAGAPCDRAPPGSLKIGILAGEASGDALGAGLMRQLTALAPDTTFLGVGGDAMIAAGLQSLAPIDLLQVNGFREPIRRLPSLLGLFNRLAAAMIDARVDVFVGVDFNVFNLLLERRLKKAGITTVHYVSPSVYAWRRGRLKRIARSADLVLTLYPFEPALYRDRGIGAHYVGHPLADRIDFDASDRRHRQDARRTLGIAGAGPVIALLPGSRMSEIRLHGQVFLDTAERFATGNPDACFVVPCVNPRIREAIGDALDARSQPLRVTCYDGDARLALTACDAALVKSGTSTLEAMLLKRPMVVTYRLGALTYQLLRRLLRTPYVALPNILAGRMLVPELLQHDGTPQRLVEALEKTLREFESGGLREQFDAIHQSLRKNADFEAAAAVWALVDQSSGRAEDSGSANPGAHPGRAPR